MTNQTTAAGTPAADPYPPWQTLGRWSAQADQRTLERERLESRAKRTDATLQLLRCFPSWTRALEQLTLRALERLAANEPVDPNDPDAWRGRDAHAQAVLHRHGKGTLSATRLTSAAITALIDGQAAADRDAGLDWSTVTTPAGTLDERLARAHATLPVDLDDPRVWAYQLDQRRVLARPLGLDDHLADDLSRWLLANPSQFDAGDLRCWRIGSDTWLSLAGERLGAVGMVERPVGVFVVPAIGIERRVAADAGARARHDPADRRARRPARARPALGGHPDRQPRRRCSSGSTSTRCTPGRRECLDSAGQLAQELSRELGVPVSPGVPRDKRDRWGRLAVRRRSYKNASGVTSAELELRVLTFPARGFTPAAARVGAARGAVRPPQRGDGPRRGRPDRGRRRPAVAALDRGGRTAEGHGARRADEGAARDAHDHLLRRRLGKHPPSGRRAGDRRAARAQARPKPTSRSRPGRDRWCG